ncbi:GTPase HflX [Chitinivibrio alkaliphilus]|uniref:GTPase HflX n=1 Tax=Chitinivibrio alkaliphilus ACht1 TaxID=1313304 RepID=U7D8F0_9BACT|nr:GTPase HflX [Chitinivibrio alkaliphilus]ERP38674.1 GTPase HflX [Chitinivibrio alkaliphilus ACht1]
MFDIEREQSLSESVILAALYMPRKMDEELFEEDLAEMETLIATAGAEVADIFVQKRDKPRFSTWFGAGKLDEISRRMKETNSKCLVIDAELKPSQIQNIEAIICGKVIDRSQLILDIFALHARTNEAKIQVELAQLNLMYPRLTRMWSHLSRQSGGIGTRGPGETQLETDKRLVQKKIAQLKKSLKKIKKSREVQRRGRSDTFRISLVGYTNVGKSTLLNALCGADVLVRDELFATLDTASKKGYIPSVGEVVISDTVGFLRKLPHHLVASFRSTLEVAQETDLLLIVMDASSKWFSHQLDTVRDVLGDLSAGHKPAKIIFNKIDRVDDPLQLRQIECEFPQASFVSALDKESVQQLKHDLGETIHEVRADKKQAAAIEKRAGTYIHVG